MRTFLQQPTATFYHITTIENWKKIQSSGFRSESGRIFVSRVGELPVLLAIALEQLPELKDTEAIAILKFPQSRNNFLPPEITIDPQAGVEWTQPFHNIILRNYIPAEHIELMMILKLGEGVQRDFLMAYFASIANGGEVNYPGHSITLQANQLQY
jgi:hypothetical protein